MKTQIFNKKQTLNCNQTALTDEPIPQERNKGQSEHYNKWKKTYKPEHREQKHNRTDARNHMGKWETKWRNYAIRRTYEEGRKDVLNTQQGNRTRSVVSLNPYNFPTRESKITVIQMIRRKKYIYRQYAKHTYRISKTLN